MYFLLATITAFSVGFLITPIVISVLRRANIGDAPGGRKIHKKFTPSMGGISFVVATFVTLAIWGWQFPLPDIRFLLGAIALMFIVGLRDDMVELKAKHKLAGQFVAVLIVVVAGDIRIKDFHGFIGVHELPLLISYGFTSFVLLALTNAFNLIDGLDGLAGTVAAISLSILGGWFYIQGLESYAVLSFSLLGGVLAFMIFNWHPAKIFMGDTGSLTLGFGLGSLIVAFMENNAALPADAFLKIQPSFTAGIVLMIYPLYDMARVFAKRVSQGKHPMTADKSHIHHFMIRMGMKHNEVALTLGLLQLSLVLLVFILGDFSDNVILPVLAAIVLALGFRLDRVTVKYVKRHSLTTPRILEIKPLTSTQRSKVKLDKEMLNPEEMNLN
ncbi:UDP-N-acetylmuramyl pentapeptide phosphotransferase/UDP-N-acetylglucosamine-1-phosphate transferase [Algoriphagus alkaliphilus]|uniref:UDP-N-acetylmuramyl pentapeptide phosphotransferase/UDP-N-acetylglucosamine-1-phosphate transferase n=1 Tax=Algoriphagus alkaliphilus TaxID=279824 RepID=A0A1G5W3Z4_9BACT|nr:MraY family glycosyltransferase [Algoriphagus alkaliphilus]MBA4298977.1 undecaprenyl/decaprenyl-phosphate alpha-N-acetylglucosaminyl 1-phosphate transferase [Cyclobacterium sp.]SDA52770.1 UDP-N-acetylmuramyl pentapeptide phosphotransferase/UDP-N-acetylglucosamine-1-phosphate transferase [Algoriphagus alkaliphilus]